MPLYSIEHISPLTEAQKDHIAERVTHFHSDVFTTPKLFVNVQFRDISQWPLYVGGKKRKYNRIIASVRSGGNRTTQMWDTVCASINKMWAAEVGATGTEELRAIFIVGGLIAGSEAGFPIPGPGEDAHWLQNNVAAFKKKAQEGDTDFQDMLEDMRSREAFRDIVDGAKTNGH